MPRYRTLAVAHPSGGKVAQPQPITGRVRLSTWATAARYDDLKVTTPDGQVTGADSVTFLRLKTR